MKAKILKLEKLSRWHWLRHLVCINDWQVTVDYEGTVKTFEAFTRHDKSGNDDLAWLFLDIQKHSPSSDLKRLEGVEVETEQFSSEAEKFLKEVLNEEVTLVN